MILTQFIRKKKLSTHPLYTIKFKYENQHNIHIRIIGEEINKPHM